MIKEITAQELNPENFITEKIKDIQDIVGDGLAINALSGGVDSSTVTMLGHRALVGWVYNPSLVWKKTDRMFVCVFQLWENKRRANF